MSDDRLATAWAQVDAFARRFNARQLWTLLGPRDTAVAKLAMYQDDQGRLMLFELFRDGGFEVFVPPCDANEIESSISAIRRIRQLDALEKEARQAFRMLLRLRDREVISDAPEIRRLGAVLRRIREG